MVEPGRLQHLLLSGVSLITQSCYAGTHPSAVALAQAVWRPSGRHSAQSRQAAPAPHLVTQSASTVQSKQTALVVQKLAPPVVTLQVPSTPFSLIHPTNSALHPSVPEQVLALWAWQRFLPCLPWQMPEQH